ncbi:hypothetical protein GCM10010251_88780 [Streptomyces aurantiogriseus]|uniref:Uncharacterized protein n=1 Tax=Streptomyces aurantiogriseus TaxID=66870 RepID=A0A918FPI8_9ACTN|nr:hypothetical protein GCM10010251_88780 [Streptomyces aurantiogriseus]
MFPYLFTRIPGSECRSASGRRQEGVHQVSGGPEKGVRDGRRLQDSAKAPAVRNPPRRLRPPEDGIAEHRHEGGVRREST